MTLEEKKMNKNDLRKYKDYDTNISAMICGLQQTPEPKRRNKNLDSAKTVNDPYEMIGREAMSRSLIANPIRNSL
jgi:hypothetical protein